MTFSKYIVLFSIGLVSLITASGIANDLDSGLITHFKFDETSGNIAYDSSGSGFDSQVLGGTQWSDGVIDGAIEFNGLDAKIDLGKPSEYSMSSFSIACWFKNDDAGRFRVITARNTSWANRQWWLTIWQNGYSSGRDAKLVFRMSPTSGNYVDLVSNQKVDDNEWHAAVVTIDSTDNGTAKLYLDNVLQQTITGFGVPKIPNASAFIGRDISGSKRFYSGQLDDLRIYNRVLTTEEISLFSEQSPPPIYYVRTRGSDSNDGLTPGTAFRTIQQAVNHCTRPGTTVYVGPGSYEESIAIGTGVGIDAIDGTESSPNSIIADPGGVYTNDDPGDVEINGGGSDQYGIRMVSRVNWVIDGFKFRDQQKINIYATNSGLSILNCDLEVPSMYSIYATTMGDIMIADCNFVRSTTSRHVIWVTPMNRTTATSVIITRNDATLKDNLYMSSQFHLGYSYNNGEAKGGGNSSRYRYTYGIIVFGWGRPLVDRVEISNNQLSDFYLPIYTALYSTASSGSVVSNNTVTGSYYGIYSFSYKSQSSYLINNIIDTCYLGLISYAYRGQTPVISGLLEHNITYNMSRYNRPFEFDIIQSNPSFTDAAAGDYSLQRGSLAIDAGVSTNAPSTDIDGRSRPTDGDSDGIARIDLGAYELVTNPTRIKVVQWREISGHRDMSGE